MSRISVHGIGAVSPAGWGTKALSAAVQTNEPLPTRQLMRPGADKPVQVREVPPPPGRPAFLAHPRLRRTSAISQYAIAAALEALGGDADRVRAGELRLGIVACVVAGSVSYTRRFFEEMVKDPATASPLVFPETVFNAPASHLAAYLGSPEVSYTLVGDNGAYLQGLALAAGWLLDGRADGCVVIGAEEMDWIMSDAMRLFERSAVHSDGAGALYLRAQSASSCAVEMAGITDSFPFVHGCDRYEVARKMRAQLADGGRNELLSLSAQRLGHRNAAEENAWSGWTGSRVVPNATLGEAFTASAAWQCVLACDAIQRGEFSAANVSVVGPNYQAIGARFRHRDFSTTFRKAGALE